MWAAALAPLRRVARDFVVVSGHQSFPNPSGEVVIRHRGLSLAASTTSSPKGMSRSYSSGFSKAFFHAGGTDQARLLASLFTLLAKPLPLLEGHFFAPVAPCSRALDLEFHHH